MAECMAIKFSALIAPCHVNHHYVHLDWPMREGSWVHGEPHRSVLHIQRSNSTHTLLTYKHFNMYVYNHRGKSYVCNCGSNGVLRCKNIYCHYTDTDISWMAEHIDKILHDAQTFTVYVYFHIPDRWKQETALHIISTVPFNHKYRMYRTRPPNAPIIFILLVVTVHFASFLLHFLIIFYFCIIYMVTGVAVLRTFFIFVSGSRESNLFFSLCACSFNYYYGHYCLR